MWKEILDIIISNAFEIVASILALVVTTYLIPLIKTELKPWLEEKRIYGLVKKFVEATEKLYETGTINKMDKKQKVIELLQANGIVVNETIEAFIESCVKNLDLITNTVKNEVMNKD